MEDQFLQQVDGLLEKYTELLVGDTSEELVQKVKIWALYTHLAKSMPSLVKHWNEIYPDAKAEMVQLVSDIKVLNERHRSKLQDK